MAKILNVNELAQESKVLKLNGNSHTMRKITVEDFMNSVKEVEELQEEANDEDKEIPVHVQIERMVDMIVEAFPTCPREELLALEFVQVNAILEFTVEKLDEGEDEGKGDKQK